MDLYEQVKLATMGPGDNSKVGDDEDQSSQGRRGKAISCQKELAKHQSRTGTTDVDQVSMGLQSEASNMR
jgi:hypothetical protein